MHNHPTSLGKRERQGEHPFIGFLQLNYDILQFTVEKTSITLLGTHYVL
jgi:hypothetical protein